MTLSLCMIVRDEEKTLPACLQSVQGFVDEMVVVDTGSHDRTIDIARTFGAKVFSYQWDHNFAAARNHSLQYAEGEWILVLDADEVLVPAVVPQLQQAMQNQQVLVINLLRQEVGAKQAPYSLISRLFRHHPDIYFSRPYHELIDDSVIEVMRREPSWQVIELPEIAIRHTGYQTDTIAQRQKFDRARSIMESYLAEHPGDPYICNKLGALYAELGQFKQALELLKQGLQAKPIEPPVLFELHYHLGSLYSQLQNLSRAEIHYRKATEQPISSTQKLAAYNNWANLLRDRGEWTAAIALYQKTIEIDPTFAIGYFNLGLTLKAAGDLVGAINHYQQAIHLNPNYAEVHQSLGVALLKVGQVEESLMAFRRAIELYEAQRSPVAAELRQGLRDIGFSL